MAYDNQKIQPRDHQCHWKILTNCNSTQLATTFMGMGLSLTLNVVDYYTQHS